MTVLSEKPIKAVRKRHVCDGCDKWIEIGEPAVTWCGLNDGQFCSVHYHPDCRKAEVELNGLHDWRPYDDWARLCEADAEDRPWIKENWPTPYLRLCMSRAQWAAHVGATAWAVGSPFRWEPDCLADDPFAGDFGGSGDGDRVLSDRMVTNRGGGICHSCAGECAPGSRNRVRAEVYDGELMRFRWCQTCCFAMAVYPKRPSIAERLISIGNARRAALGGETKA